MRPNFASILPYCDIHVCRSGSDVMYKRGFGGKKVSSVFVLLWVRVIVESYHSTVYFLISEAVLPPETWSLSREGEICGDFLNTKSDIFHVFLIIAYIVFC